MTRSRRRGPGEGSIRKRRDGRWEATLGAGLGADGQRRRRSVYGRTRAEVVEKLDSLRREVAQGVDAPAALTVGAYLDLFLAGKAERVRPSTRRSYERLIRVHLKPHLGSRRLRDLRAPHLRELHRALREAGASDNLRFQVHAVLKTALRQAVRDELVARSPLAAVDPPRVARPEMRTLDADEVRRLLATARETPRFRRYEAAYALAVGAALRWGEIFGLAWGDVDLDGGTVHVRRQLGEEGLLAPPKSKTSRRPVTLPAFVVDALRRQRARLGALPHRDRLVFTDVLGGPVRRSNLHARHWKPLLRAAKLPDIRFHDLRHTAATLMFASGVHPKVVQERLGHASIALTLDTYSHAVPALDREAAERLDSLLTAGKR